MPGRATAGLGLGWACARAVQSGQGGLRRSSRGLAHARLCLTCWVRVILGNERSDEMASRLSGSPGSAFTSPNCHFLFPRKKLEIREKQTNKAK